MRGLRFDEMLSNSLTQAENLFTKPTETRNACELPKLVCGVKADSQTLSGLACGGVRSGVDHPNGSPVVELSQYLLSVFRLA
jgi:hypothetical protein